MVKSGDFKIKDKGYLNHLNSMMNKNPNYVSVNEEMVFNLLRIGMEQTDSTFIKGERIDNTLVLTNIDGSEITIAIKKTK